MSKAEPIVLRRFFIKKLPCWDDGNVWFLKAIQNGRAKPYVGWRSWFAWGWVWNSKGHQVVLFNEVVYETADKEVRIMDTGKHRNKMECWIVAFLGWWPVRRL